MLENSLAFVGKEFDSLIENNFLKYLYIIYE